MDQIISDKTMFFNLHSSQHLKDLMQRSSLKTNPIRKGTVYRTGGEKNVSFNYWIVKKKLHIEEKFTRHTNDQLSNCQENTLLREYVSEK